MGFLNSDPRGEIKQIGFLKLDDSGNALMQNSRLFEVDDEVVFTLGHYSNNEYLLNYGFVPAGNDYDCLEIPHFSALEINRIGYPIADLAQIIQSKRIECYGATQEQAVIIDILNNFLNMNVDEKLMFAKNYAERSVNTSNNLETIIWSSKAKKIEVSLVKSVLDFVMSHAEIANNNIKEFILYRKRAQQSRQNFASNMVAYYRSRIILCKRLMDSLLNPRFRTSSAVSYTHLTLPTIYSV
eukprot:TRINITY_DN4915_c0_g2_i16.p1 TRINITY_DN4915_c0_g2~~TRINITY_DN4915_c0_g2_i16.p1  ORF type:complete len:241 (-),score=13.89 TRINITY_DN4915_c0_g2_i16:36-758(-)